MQGKILIVDAIATNRIVLKVKLASAFYNVVQACSMSEAVRVARTEQPDLIITSLALPDGDAGALCKAMQTSPLSEHIPILAVGCQVKTEVRIATLEAGVHDVLQKPLDDTLLLGRVRSLIRAHNAAAEWQVRDDTSRALGLAEPQADFGPAGRITLVSSDRATALGWVRQLRPLLRCKLKTTDPGEVLSAMPQEAIPDAFVLVLSDDPARSDETLRLISALRANAATRHAGVLALQTSNNPALAANALDLGADDLMSDGFEPAELALRLRALLRRKQIADQLRATVRTGLRAAVYDSLTGLHNRRYAMPHLQRIVENRSDGNGPFAVMIADLDHFKRINDIFGHASGDAVLVETARRLRSNLRAVDMIARLGGEEFLIVMPGTTMTDARATASRLCEQIGTMPFVLPGHPDPQPVTISIGLAIGGLGNIRASRGPETADSLLELADRALYSAKTHGRNQVTLSRPAA